MSLALLATLQYPLLGNTDHGHDARLVRPLCSQPVLDCVDRGVGCGLRTGRYHCTDTTLRPVGASGALGAAFFVIAAIVATVTVVPCRSPASCTVFPAF